MTVGNYTLSLTMSGIQSWKIGYESVRECYLLEESILVGTELFDLIAYAEHLVRNQLATGAGEPASKVADLCRNAYSAWLDKAKQQAERIDALERTVEIDGSLEFSKRVSMAEERIESLRNPVVPRLAPGMKPWEMTEEESQQLTDLMNAPPDSPGKLRKMPRSLPQGDPAAIRKLK